MMCRRALALQFMRHPLVKFVSAVVYLVGALLLFIELSYNWWPVSIFTAVICAFNFRPFTVAVGLASIALLTQQNAKYTIISAVSSEWPFHPYMFYPDIIPLTIYAASGVAISFILRWALGLLRKGLMGKDYGGKSVMVDVVLASALYIATTSLLYVSTHREDDVAIMNLYMATLDNSVAELTTTASDSSLSTDERAAAILAISGMGFDVNDASERQCVLAQIEMDSRDTNDPLNFAAKLALRTLETSPQSDGIDLPYYSDARIKELMFFSSYQWYRRISRHWKNGERLE